MRLLGRININLGSASLKMKEYWDQFIFGYCKVEFLCWQSDPNWLGWIVIGIFALILFGIGWLISIFVYYRVYADLFIERSWRSTQIG